MRVKRGQNYPGLNFSGPQSTNVINEAEELAERLEARNQWAYQMRAYYPDLPEILQVERCTEYPVTRFKRDLVLRFDATDGWWEVAGYVPPPPIVVAPPVIAVVQVAPSERDDDDAPAADNGEATPDEIAAAETAPTESEEPKADDDTPPDDSDGHQPRQPRSARGARKGAAPKQEGGDEFRPISTAPRRAIMHHRPQSELALYLWKARAYVRTSPLCRHTMSVFKDTMAKMKRATAQFVIEARDALLLAHGFSTSFSNTDQIVQESWFDTVFEPRVFERSGRRFTLLTFSNYAEPNWEHWLFGRRPEDEQVAA